MALDSALPELKKMVEARGYFLGRYRLGDLVHRSATCKVQKADDVQDNDRDVVLKLMRERDQFDRELQAREQFALDKATVVDVLDQRELDVTTGGAFFREGHPVSFFLFLPYCQLF